KKKKDDAPASSRGLEARRLVSTDPPANVRTLAERVERDGGVVIGSYRDPLGGNWQILAALPLDRVEPTPYQRDLSEAHVGKLANAIDKLDRYLDPVIAVPAEDGKYWSPNGYHRIGAMRNLGARSIVALVVPEPEVAHRILALNTEKAHNLRERALEVVRLAEALAQVDDRPEKEFETEFEEPALLTLGMCYQINGRFSGGAFHSILKRIDKFSSAKLPKAVEARRERAAKLMELNDAVNAAIASLKARGMESPYLRAFVVARINPIRFQRKSVPDFDETIDKMIASAKKFDASKIKADQVARTGGPPSEEGS
ncbi:MAG: ParB N-terminal domain-containing protein, partial [Gemmatimonadaceae bacterium]